MLGGAIYFWGGATFLGLGREEGSYLGLVVFPFLSFSFVIGLRGCIFAFHSFGVRVIGSCIRTFRFSMGSCFGLNN